MILVNKYNPLHLKESKEQKIKRHMKHTKKYLATKLVEKEMALAQYCGQGEHISGTAQHISIGEQAFNTVGGNK